MYVRILLLSFFHYIKKIHFLFSYIYMISTHNTRMLGECGIVVGIKLYIYIFNIKSLFGVPGVSGIVVKIFLSTIYLDN